MAKSLKSHHVHDYSFLIEVIKATPQKCLWSSYDEAADVLYINFKKPIVATDSKVTDDDVIIRYEENEIIGYTILHASKRNHIEL